MPSDFLSALRTALTVTQFTLQGSSATLGTCPFSFLNFPHVGGIVVAFQHLTTLPASAFPKHEEVSKMVTKCLTTKHKLSNRVTQMQQQRGRNDSGGRCEARRRQGGLTALHTELCSPAEGWK